MPDLAADAGGADRLDIVLFVYELTFGERLEVFLVPAAFVPAQQREIHPWA